MQSDIDAQPTNSFEEAPPRDFVTAMRGYDRQQVDEHISQIEAGARQHREQAHAMQRAAAQSTTQKLVSETEQRASAAEQRAAKASVQGDQTRRDADQHARQLVSNATKNADQIVSQAKAQAEQLLTEVKTDAERRRAAGRREVDDLTRQQDSIVGHLAQVRQLLVGQLPGTDAAQAKPASAGDPGHSGPARG